MKTSLQKLSILSLSILQICFFHCYEVRALSLLYSSRVKVNGIGRIDYYGFMLTVPLYPFLCFSLTYVFSLEQSLMLKHLYCTLFPKLPPELQLMIWEAALDILNSASIIA